MSFLRDASGQTYRQRQANCNTLHPSGKGASDNNCQHWCQQLLELLLPFNLHVLFTTKTNATVKYDKVKPVRYATVRTNPGDARMQLLISFLFYLSVISLLLNFKLNVWNFPRAPCSKPS